MKRIFLLPALVLAIVTMGAPLHAQEAAHKGYMDAMAKMNQAMPKDSSGNADVDFARMMVPHHQSAIDMADNLLRHGKDAKLRKMAEKMKKDQKKEITELQAWLKAHAK